MPENALSVAHPLSQGERVLDTFVAPTETFSDVQRNATWWLPFLLLTLAVYLLTFAIQTKVGWTQLVENEIRANPRLSDRLASLTPEQVAAQRRAMRYSFSYGFYASPLINLASFAVMALVLWPTINFVSAGAASYSRILAVVVYGSLPNSVSALLASILLFAGRDPSSFTTQAMLGSNPGYYLDTAGPLKVFLSSLDFFSIWSAILLAIGVAVVGRTKRSSGYIAVFGWWLLIVAGKTAVAALNS